MLLYRGSAASQVDPAQDLNPSLLSFISHSAAPAVLEDEYLPLVKLSLLVLIRDLRILDRLPKPPKKGSMCLCLAAFVVQPESCGVGILAKSSLETLLICKGSLSSATLAMSRRLPTEDSITQLGAALDTRLDIHNDFMATSLSAGADSKAAFQGTDLAKAAQTRACLFKVLLSDMRCISGNSSPSSLVGLFLCFTQSCLKFSSTRLSGACRLFIFVL